MEVPIFIYKNIVRWLNWSPIFITKIKNIQTFVGCCNDIYLFIWSLAISCAFCHYVCHCVICICLFDNWYNNWIFVLDEQLSFCPGPCAQDSDTWTVMFRLPLSLTFIFFFSFLPINTSIVYSSFPTSSTINQTINQFLLDKSCLVAMEAVVVEAAAPAAPAANAGLFIIFYFILSTQTHTKENYDFFFLSCKN